MPEYRSETDLRQEQLHVRATALGEAQRSWGEPGDTDLRLHGHQVTWLASAFERYLLDGTVAPDPDDEQVVAAPEQAVARGFAGLAESWRRATESQNVVGAALNWVDAAHENNPAGPDNWRNWADEKDINLINAVRKYRGLEPIE